MRGALLAALLGAAPSTAAPVPRTVLAAYVPALIPGRVKDVYFDDLHQHAELPLNHIGLVARYLDATGPLPDPASLPEVRGVVTWFPSEHAFSDPRPFCRWLSAGMARGWRVALLGKIGLYEAGDRERLAPECAQALRALGVEAAGTHPVAPLDVALSSKSELLGFERAVDLSERGFVPLARRAPGADATAELRLTLNEGRWPVVEPVILSRSGGVALDPFLLYANQELDPVQYRWIVDPFSFLRRALGAAGEPVPDPTTLSGRRLFFTHVDGDGFYNASEVQRGKTAGEVFLREFVERRPDVPFTLSLIAGYLDLPLYDDGPSLALARRALTEPNVEPASHGYAHPMSWREGTVALRIPRYKMDERREVVESGRLLSKALLGGRPIALMLWTGDCLPGAAAVEAATQAGLLQMNGGGGRMDARYPSYAYLFPLARLVGSARQFYAPDSNENVFTGLWTGPMYGFREAVETFERTGAPRRVKPVDVYVHFYSAERYAALRALRAVYAWADGQPLIRVFATRYLLAARGFFEMRVEREGPRRFRLEGGDGLRTVRFDGEAGAPDLARSRGVIGWRREGGSLYVALAETGPRELELGDGRETGPRLEEANFEVRRWTAAGGGAAFEKSGWGPGACTIAGLAAGRGYAVSGGGLDGVFRADGAGRLSLSFPRGEDGGAAARVEIRPA